MKIVALLESWGQSMVTEFSVSIETSLIHETNRVMYRNDRCLKNNALYCYANKLQHYYFNRCFYATVHVSYEYFVDRATANAILSVFRITLLY